MTDKRIKWHLERWKIADLKPYKKNPRIITEEGLKHLKNSFDDIGFAQPININIDGTILSGHARTQQLKADGETEVDVYVPDRKLTPKQEEAVIVRMNKNTAGMWDFDILANEFEMDDLLDWGFEPDDFDIDIEEIPGMTDEDSVPELQPDPIAKRGDIWILGNHRLMCGDSTLIDDIDKLMDGKKSNMVFTDPPYLMNFTGAVNADGSKSFGSKHGAIKNDKMSREDGDIFMRDIVANIKIVNEGAYYICFYRLGVDYVFRALDENDLKYRAQIVWFKKGGTLSNSDYKSNYEPIIYGWVNEHKFYGGKAEWDFWDISKTRKNDLHPTMKPVELCERAIKNSSERNGIVLDLFGGGGSTLIACEKLTRHALMMELDEKYCDVIIKRWQDYTGKEATLESTGETYNSLNLGDDNG